MCVRQVMEKKLGRKLTRQENKLHIPISRRYHAPPPGPLVEAPYVDPHDSDYD